MANESEINHERLTQNLITFAGLFSTLYVGESAYGLYALSAFVDEQTITFAPKYLGPPLIEAGSALAVPVRGSTVTPIFRGGA